MFLFCNKLHKLFFFILIQNKIQVSLRYYKSIKNNNKLHKQQLNIDKTNKSCEVRTSAVTFRFCGVITIEAALCLFLFMTLMLSLVSVLQIWEVHGLVQRALTSAGQEGAVLCTENFGTAEIYALGLKELAKTHPGDYGVSGGAAGISLIGSSVDSGTGTITLKATYRIHPPILFIPGLYMYMSNQVVLKAWCGYKGDVNGGGSGGNTGTRYYVTDNQSVYHTNPECTHIHLSIYSSDATLVSAQTNQYGRHYHSCSKCHSEGATGTVYITPEGDRYHTSPSCSGLKRSLHEIEDTKGLPPCSRCGGGL